MTRGVLYITFDGDPRVNAAMERSIGSLREHHPDMEVQEQVLVPGSLLSKSRMMDLSPFDTTLFLDADTVVLGPLDHVFDRAERHGLACCICECPWARRFAGLSEMRNLQEWNTGVIGFTRQASQVFESWKAIAPTLNSSLKFIDNETGETKLMEQNDQAAFALAIEQTGFVPWTLPLNYNFRPIWQHTVFGPVVVWHDYRDVPEHVINWNSEQNAENAVLNCARFK